ncbi:MAG: 30S ribosome-binding factor RbfA [Thiotrichales bacterium]
MPKEFSRTLRLGEQIHRELSVLLSREVKDPGMGLTTISEVEVSSDLGHAKVYYTVLGDESQKDSTARALERAKGYLRGQLGKGLHTRITPELHFIYDETEERGAELEMLIAKALHKGESEPD